jgi:hypothetical protein
MLFFEQYLRFSGIDLISTKLAAAAKVLLMPPNGLFHADTLVEGIIAKMFDKIDAIHL